MPRRLSILFLSCIEERQQQRAGIYRRKGLRPPKKLQKITFARNIARAYLPDIKELTKFHRRQRLLYLNPIVYIKFCRPIILLDFNLTALYTSKRYILALVRSRLNVSPFIWAFLSGKHVIAQGVFRCARPVYFYPHPRNTLYKRLLCADCAHKVNS